jgi:class 3 adenylate cyclase
MERTPPNRTLSSSVTFVVLAGLKRKPYFLPVAVSCMVIGLVCLCQALSHVAPHRGEPGLARERIGNKSDLGWDFFERLEWMLYDWRVRLAARHGGIAGTNLGGVLIDDASATTLLSGALGYRYGLLWPRDVHARLLRELTAEGARAVGFDVLFSELRPDHDRFTQAGNPKAPTPDQLFASALAGAGNGVLAAAGGSFPAELFRTNAWALGDISASIDPDGILRRARAFHDYRVWHPAIRGLEKPLRLQLESAVISTNRISIPRADGEEPYEVPMNADGSLNLDEITGKRPSAPQAPMTTQRVWHMGIVLAARELGLDLDHAEVLRDRILLRGADAVRREIPIDGAGCFYIDWTFSFPDARLTLEPIQALLERSLSRERGDAALLTNRWKDKLVVVGSVATGNNLSDIGATPLAEGSFLLGKYWNVANSVLMDRFVRRSPPGVEFLLIIGMGALAAVLTWNLRVLQASFLVVACGVLYTAIAVGLFIQSRCWLPIVLPVFGALLMNHVSLVTCRVVFEQKERRRVKSVFARIVSPEVVNELLNAEKISLGGAQREVTVLFADVRDFTGFTESVQSQAREFVRQHRLEGAEAEMHLDRQASETLATVNAYLSLVADMVKKHQGTLDKYIGDCVMAFWGAPAPDALHAGHCVRAAVDAHRAIDALNLRRAEENTRRESLGESPLPALPILHFGTGINTGKVTVGLMGSDAHILNYTVFGHEVNLASRLEAASGVGRILISEATRAALRQTDPALADCCVEQPPLAIKGIQHPVRVFEVDWKSDHKTHAPN